jgi:glyceraldehyde-3-phosphate dehydrogenase (NAD(P))
MADRNSVLVIGTGTIGEPLIGLLATRKEKLGLDEVMFYKHSPRLDDRSKIVNLEKKGAVLAADADRHDEFKKLGIKPTYSKMEALENASVVIDCTPTGYGHENKKKYYENFEHNTKGFIAQGSEFGFGKMFVHGVNDEALIPGEDKYLQVVSCNTHNLASLIHTFALSEGLDNLVDASFVCMRRSNDISQVSKYAPAPTVGDHKNERFGTHHAKDAYHLFQTLGMDLNLFSSAIVLNTQYMHTMWFDMKFEKSTTMESLLDRAHTNPHIAATHKQSANLVFSFGRDYGYYGRILNNTVLVLPSLHLSADGKRFRGFCFTPQDGNSLLTSVAAALWSISPSDYQERLAALSPFLYDEI